MIDNAKPREFWINKREMDVNGVPFVAQGKPDEEFIAHNGVYHVIEKSAYDALKAENEKLKVECLNCEAYLEGSAEWEDEARTAKAKLAAAERERDDLLVDQKTLRATIEKKDTELDQLRDAVERLKMQIPVIVGECAGLHIRSTLNAQNADQSYAYAQAALAQAKKLRDALDGHQDCGADRTNSLANTIAEFDKLYKEKSRE